MRFKTHVFLAGEISSVCFPKYKISNIGRIAIGGGSAAEIDKNTHTKFRRNSTKTASQNYKRRRLLKISFIIT